jgi:hypothetical protein
MIAMKKIVLFVIALTTTIVSAQDLIKVKGNREVTTEIRSVGPFKTLEINSDYEIQIVAGASPQIEITTDSNLHQHLNTSVIDGKLIVTITATIRSKKEMKFRIVYGPELKTITVTDHAELSSLTSLVFEELELNIREDAEVFLTASIERLTLNAGKSTKAELNLRGHTAVINLKDNAAIQALIRYDSLALDMKDRVDARIEGDIKKGQLILSDKASIEGTNLIFDILELKINQSATAEVNVKSALSLEASDDAKVSLYNTPEIDLNLFTGKAVLKKE